MPVLLVSPEDLGAAGYRNLVDRGRHRDADRLGEVFVVEGVRTIRQLLDQGWPLDSVLLSPSRIDGRPDLAADAASAGAAVYVAGQDLFDRIAGYHAHRGALALARRPPARRVESVVGPARLVLVVEGVNDHENLGALFRNAAAFGAGAVVLDPSAAEPLYRRSVRVSVGHVLRVPFARATTWPADLSVLPALGFTVVALSPAGRLTLDDLAPGAPARRESRGDRWAVMVGAEGDGLSAEALAAADMAVRIPMAPGVDSVNVATAAALALHQLAAR